MVSVCSDFVWLVCVLSECAKCVCECGKLCVLSVYGECVVRVCGECVC